MHTENFAKLYLRLNSKDVINYWVMHPVALVSIKYWNNLCTQESIFWC
jgi:hypothetical protein